MNIESNLSCQSAQSFLTRIRRRLFPKLLLAPLLLAGQDIPLFAADHYIRADATGANDGSSWANAWTSFRAVSWTRGDTYYLAGGTYNESTFIYIHPAASGTSTVTIKKANPTNNSGDPGWNPAFATGVAYINGPSGSPFPVLDFANGYIRIDGVTGNGTSGHGIVIYNPSHTDVVLLENGDGYSVSHCELKGAGYTGTADGYSGIQWTNGKGTYIGYNWIHAVTINGAVFSSVTGTSYSDYGLIFENNVISETGGCTDPNKHGQGMQLGFNSELAYCIIRNSVIRNTAGSAMIAFLGGASANHHDIRIHNNVFYITDPETYSILSPGAIWSHVQAKKTNVSILNNIFYNLNGPLISGSIVLETPTPVNTILANNVWENCRMIGNHIGISSETNNGYFGNVLNVPNGTTNQINGISSTFVSARDGNFSLKTGGYAIGSGLNTSIAFPTDPTVALSTAGGEIWDLGAYKFGVQAMILPVPPSNARVLVRID